MTCKCGAGMTVEQKRVARGDCLRYVTEYSCPDCGTKVSAEVSRAE